MNRQLEEALVEALELLEQDTPVVKILSLYPELADELRPYLMTALDLNHLANSSSIAAQEASKSEFLEYAAAMHAKKLRPRAAWLREILVSSIAVLFILFFAGVVMAVSSSEAIPGDSLYDTKLFLEQMRLNYSANPEAASALIEALHQERLDEVTALMSLGRQEIVTFSGAVEELATDRWIVEGIPVAITSSTIIHDDVEVGFLVQVTGKTSSHAVLAEEVEVMAVRSPDSDLNDLPPQVEPSTVPLPTIEPLKIPERPELLLPDSGSVTPPSPLEPDFTTSPEDDLAGDEDIGYEDVGEQLESQQDEDDNQKEMEDAGGKSSNDEQDESDEREIGENQNDDSGEVSGENEEEKEEQDSDRQDAAGEEDKNGEVESTKSDEAKDGKSNPPNEEDPDKID